jgi:hypothetical protein
MLGACSDDTSDAQAEAKGAEDCNPDHAQTLSWWSWSLIGS